jgi:hypothetical protein
MPTSPRIASKDAKQLPNKETPNKYKSGLASDLAQAKGSKKPTKKKTK